jgi:hypothetical protein
MPEKCGKDVLKRGKNSSLFFCYGPEREVNPFA